jgi:hypothetical protein
VRDLNRTTGTSYTVVLLSGRGKGSHGLVTVMDGDKELGRAGTTSHMGDTVIANFERAFEHLFGEGWL